MSTKIYYGVRFPQNRLPDFLRAVRIDGLEAVYREALRMVRGVDKRSDEFKAIRERYPKDSLRASKIRLTLNHIRHAADHPDDLPWATLDCGYRIWLPPGSRYALAHPWGRIEIPLPDYVEPYGYWDQTDKPDEIPQREWRRREKAWEIATGPYCEDHHLMVEVFKVERSIARGVPYHWLQIRLHRKGWGKPA